MNIAAEWVSEALNISTLNSYKIRIVYVMVVTATNYYSCESGLELQELLGYYRKFL
jgi:hypothetical protein